MVRRLTTALACAAALALAPAALADGDPASDILFASDVYLPYSPKPGKHLSRILVRTLRQARKHGYPMKVALIQGPADLGAYPTLFGHPRKYAELLNEELGYGELEPHLLVVMPAGFAGVRLVSNHRRILRGVPIQRRKRANGLVRAAIEAVAKLATAAGHPTKIPFIP
jgi:hypothetical protein